MAALTPRGDKTTFVASSRLGAPLMITRTSVQAGEAAAVGKSSRSAFSPLCELAPSVACILEVAALQNTGSFNYGLPGSMSS
jgi:hypothetical protein